MFVIRRHEQSLFYNLGDLFRIACALVHFGLTKLQALMCKLLLSVVLKSAVHSQVACKQNLALIKGSDVKRIDKAIISGNK